MHLLQLSNFSTFNLAMAHLYVGTSGFSYPEWKGTFYPPDLPGKDMLRFYAQTFRTVEINNTFYRYPKEDTLAQWTQAVPGTFKFSIKAHQRITHRKRLADVDADLAFLFERMRALGERLGPLLFQLPPALRCDLSLLETFLLQLRPGAPVVIEFRHRSWRENRIYQMLEAHHVSLCAAETDDEEQPRERVGPISYLRLHKSRYTPEDLNERAGWIADRLKEGRDVFAYFTHEEGAPAPEYARALSELVRSA